MESSQTDRVMRLVATFATSWGSNSWVLQRANSTIAGTNSRTLCVEAPAVRESCHLGIDSECNVRINRVRPTTDSLTVTNHLISLSWLLIGVDPPRGGDDTRGQSTFSPKPTSCRGLVVGPMYDPPTAVSWSVRKY